MLQKDTQSVTNQIYGLAWSPRGPRPGARLHLYMHFAVQIDKKTLKHNTTRCSVSLLGPTHKNLEVTEKATYLIYQYFQTVSAYLCNIQVVTVARSSRLVGNQDFFIIRVWFFLVLAVMCNHSHQTKL